MASYLAVRGQVTTDQFLTVFTVVIAFYFGTQAERKAAVEPAELLSGTLVSGESEPAAKA